MSVFGSKPKNSASSSSSTPLNNSVIGTIIGENCVIDGNLTAQSSIKIDGKINGDIKVQGTVVIGDKGYVKGDLRSSDIMIFGRLDGNVYADNLNLRQSARILGNIETKSLQVEPGAAYQGTVTMQSSSAASVTQSMTTSTASSSLPIDTSTKPIKA